MAATATILKLVSVDFRENGLLNRVNFDCACWGRVGEGAFRKSACFDFQYGCHGHQLEIGFR
jgi:hypothetical protein